MSDQTSDPRWIVERYLKAFYGGDGAAHQCLDDDFCLSGRSDIVLRVYEHSNRRVTTTIRFGRSIKSAFRTNLMEEDRELLPVNANAVVLELHPFEVTTLLLVTTP